MLPTESIRQGIQTSLGPLQVKKTDHILTDLFEFQRGDLPLVFGDGGLPARFSGFSGAATFYSGWWCVSCCSPRDELRSKPRFSIFTCIFSTPRAEKSPRSHLRATVFLKTLPLIIDDLSTQIENVYLLICLRCDQKYLFWFCCPACGTLQWQCFREVQLFDCHFLNTN